MSREIYDRDSVSAHSFCGPTGTTSKTRMRLQLNVYDAHSSLAYEDVVELNAAIGQWLLEFGSNVKVEHQADDFVAKSDAIDRVQQVLAAFGINAKVFNYDARKIGQLIGELVKAAQIEPSRD